MTGCGAVSSGRGAGAFSTAPMRKSGLTMIACLPMQAPDAKELNDSFTSRDRAIDLDQSDAPDCTAHTETAGGSLLLDSHQRIRRTEAYAGPNQTGRA